ncbi:MAG: undecaprenyl/decaprenyl-phosphate alpha-N-acetylglucosaminyl 1-phosphate transferase [Candidatus Omnitrophica bacterium]|nr:undecaprenyl/decaprenyl-phosphate alpha-N-acetylglucosaminyl 1-phosphate transferase [Candidatus Omnitrophota bacterium]
MRLVVIFSFSFLIAYLSTPLFRKLALKFKILDKPGRRKIHKKSIPLLGGLAVYLSMILGFALNFTNLRSLLGILIGATLILIMGVIDDIRGLSAQFRLVGQVIAALIIISFGIRLSFLPDNLWGNAGEILLTLIWIVGITNAFNCLDGIDGLASGTAAVSALFFSIISYQTHQPLVGLTALILMAGCLGFLPHNLKKEKIFLGDGGSTFIGFILAGIAILGNWAEDNVVKLIIPVLILGVPIFDMTFTTIMRIRKEKISSIVEWLKYAGKDHFHHYLIDLGLYQEGAMLFICFISVSFGISAIMVSNENAVVGFFSILQAFIIFAGIAILMIVGKRRRGRRHIHNKNQETLDSPK